MAINHPDALPQQQYCEPAPRDYSSHQAPLFERGNANPEKQRIKPAVLHEQPKVKDVYRPHVDTQCSSTECRGLKSDGYQGSLIRRQNFAPEGNVQAEESALHQDQSSREPETNPRFIDAVSALIAQKLEAKGRLQTVDPSDIRKLVQRALSRNLNGFRPGDVHATSVIRGEVKSSLRNWQESKRAILRDERRSVLKAKQSGLDTTYTEEDRLDFEEEAAARYPQTAEVQSETLWTEEEIALLGEEAAMKQDPRLAWAGDVNLARKTAEYRGDIDYVAEEEREKGRQVSTSPSWEA